MYLVEKKLYICIQKIRENMLWAWPMFFDFGIEFVIGFVDGIVKMCHFGTDNAKEVFIDLVKVGQVFSNTGKVSITVV